MSHEETQTEQPTTEQVTTKTEQPTTEQVTTKKVTLDVEIDTKPAKDIGPNPYSKMIHLAEAVDAWRIFPRIFISVYMFLLIHVVIWFTKLPDPSMEQSGLISVVVGAGAAWFGLYANTGSGRSVKVPKQQQ